MLDRICLNFRDPVECNAFTCWFGKKELFVPSFSVVITIASFDIFRQRRIVSLFL